MWGKSSNSHFGKTDTTVALILSQKEKKKPKQPKMLVHFISHLFFMQDETVPWREGHTKCIHPSRMAWKPHGLPHTGGFPRLSSSSSSFNLIPPGSIRGGASLEAKSLWVNPLHKPCLYVKMLLNWGVGEGPSYVYEPEEASVP